MDEMRYSHRPSLFVALADQMVQLESHNIEPGLNLR
jgi:hypothetical protein